VKIKLIDAVRARDAVQWLMANVGPQQAGAVGTVVRGEGWQCWVKYYSDDLTDLPEFFIELNQHVDEDTKLLFALKWA
jgi:hypothetical protein